jgi:hypothetical protein
MPSPIDTMPKIRLLPMPAAASAASLQRPSIAASTVPMS